MHARAAQCPRPQTQARNHKFVCNASELAQHCCVCTISRHEDTRVLVQLPPVCARVPARVPFPELFLMMSHTCPATSQPHVCWLVCNDHSSSQFSVRHPWTSLGLHLSSPVKSCNIISGRKFCQKSYAPLERVLPPRRNHFFASARTLSHQCILMRACGVLALCPPHHRCQMFGPPLCSSAGLSMKADVPAVVNRIHVKLHAAKSQRNIFTALVQ